MSETRLMETATRLAQPSPESARAFDAARDRIAAELNRRMNARPDLDRMIGPGNRSMMEDNSRNFCRFMSSMFHEYRPDVLVKMAVWVFRAYRSHGFEIAYWPANLDTCLEIVRETLDENAFGEIRPFYEWLIVNIPAFTEISDRLIHEGIPARPRA